jgi:hypothetical protein
MDSGVRSKTNRASVRLLVGEATAETKCPVPPRAMRVWRWALSYSLSARLQLACVGAWKTQGRSWVALVPRAHSRRIGRI